jgi:ubiquinone/menaquinone biosynthesis C-methylase UbiE
MAFSDPQRNIEQFGLSEGMRVADFGAGSGAYALAAAQKVGRDGRIYAIDIQQELLGRLADAARGAKGSTVEVLQGDIERPGGSKLGDAAVDAVLVANILFQVADKGAFLEEARRVLKPRGRLLIIDWRDSFDGMGPSAEHVVTETSAKRLASDAGFTAEKNIQAGDHHYGIVFRKSTTI